MSTIARTQATDENGLLQIVKRARIEGKSYMEIERAYGISAPRAEAMIKAYYRNMAVQIDPNEQRLLMLERFEALIGPLMDMAQLGNIKSAEVLIKNLEAINSLLGLNLEATKVEITVVTQKQTTVIVDMVGSVTKDLLALVQERVSDQKELALIEDEWDAKVANSFQRTAEEVIDAELIVEG